MKRCVLCQRRADPMAIICRCGGLIQPTPEPLNLPPERLPGVPRKTHKARVRAKVYARDKHRCVECGTDKHLTLDHIRPLSKGGTNRIENLQTMCSSCNNRKGDEMPEPAVAA